MSQGHRRLAAIMFTDMVGYTSIGQTHESLSLVLVEDQRKLIRPILHRHNGREVKTIGDGFIVEFSSALDAAKCAYEIQEAARQFNRSRPPPQSIYLRIGIHVGDVVESQGDILGDAVNVASRVESLAEEGGVILTRQVYDQIQNKLEFPLKNLGIRHLKNLATPLEVFKMQMPWEHGGAPFSQFDRKRIAVLPFMNISPDPNDAYFADGVTEELISTMSRISGLKVIARTSVIGYKGSPKKISEIGKELEVGSILEGSVRKVADKLRISVQLIDSHTSEHLWAMDYDRELRDVFAIQSDISKTVSGALAVRLLSSEKALIENKQAANPDGYALYLKGRVYWNERTREDIDRALKLFEQAIKVDPTLAPAYSGIADCYNVLGNYSWMATDKAGPLAMEFARKALQLDDRLAEAHASLGFTLMNYSWQFRSAEREFKRAIELRPNYAMAYNWYSQLLYFQRKHSDASAQDMLAVEIDPVSYLAKARIAESLGELGSDEAIERFNHLIEMYPDHARLHASKSRAYSMRSEHDLAVDEAKRALELEKSPDLEVGLASTLAFAGRKDEARAILSEIESRGFKEPYSLGYVGAVKLELGDSDEGWRLLEKGFEEREDGVLYFSSMPVYRKYWSDPRWITIEKKLAAIEAE